MHWKPNTQEDIPIFRQITQYFERQILSGKLSPGESLPPERALAKLLDVNRSTVTAAYEELRGCGLVKSVQGSGTKVSEDLWGVSVHPTPSWHEYISGGMFRPSLPLVRRIREASLYDGIINFARGELSPDLFPVQKLNEVIQGIHLDGPLGYANPSGLSGLRQVLIKHVKEQYGIRATPSELLITSGAQQALHLITSCLLKPGDAIALESPSYAYSLSLFTSAGLRLFPIPMDEHGLIPGSIPSLVKKHRIRMVFVNPTFQNPTGTTLPLERRRELLEICETFRLPIVEDDPYGALNFDGHVPPPSLITMAKGSSQVLYLGSLSKTVAPALRMGWMIGPTNVIDRLADAKQQMDFGTSAISQQIVQVFMESGKWQENIASLRQILQRRRDTMVSALETNLKAYMTWTVPQGSYHIWGRLTKDVEDTDLLEACIRHGVIFMPSGVYGAGRGWVRLTYARAAEEEIKEGVERLKLGLTSI